MTLKFKPTKSKLLCSENHPNPLKSNLFAAKRAKSKHFAVKRAKSKLFCSIFEIFYIKSWERGALNPNSVLCTDQALSLAFSAVNPGSALNPRTLNTGTTVLSTS